MDRIDAMKVFVAALDEGILAGAGQNLGRSPAAVSRAVAFLEDHVGVQLLHRTTRSSKLSEVGARYATACRRLLIDLDEVKILAASGQSDAGGTLTLTAPILSGEEVLRPILDDFLDAFPAVSAKLHLCDRPLNLIDEGIDAALRIGHLSDSSMVAIRVGIVRPVVVAAPSYLARNPPISSPGDIGKQQVITFSQGGLNTWTFSSVAGSSKPRTVQFTSHCVVNTARAALASAVEGWGLTRLSSYQVAEYIRDGRLQILLGPNEFAPVPVHLIVLEGRLSVPKVRAFVDFTVPRLRARFLHLIVGTML